jgi:hypothetical protein
MLGYFGNLFTKVFYNNDEQKEKEKEKESHLDEYDIIERITSPTNNTYQSDSCLNLNALSVIENKQEQKNVDIFIPNTKKILDKIIYDDNRFQIFNKYRAIHIKKFECNFSKHKLIAKKRSNTRKKNYRILQ